MTVDRAAVVACAREYLGTPFHHQGRVKGVGVDCAGLVIGVARELGISDFDVGDYGRQPDLQTFRAILRAQMREKPFAEVAPGDVLTFAVPTEQHLGIVTGLEPLTFLHAWERAGQCVEHRLDGWWQQRVRGCFAFAELG